MAPHIDAVLIGLTLISLVFFIAVCFAVIVFAIRYRRGSNASRAHDNFDHNKLEIAWTVIPLFMALGVFWWSAVVFFDMNRVPEGASEILVTGKQWMWKIQHQNGRREINELHVPLGRPIKLTMTSEDVIHSFFVPAFRYKKDVLPGRYTTLWFEATKTGTFHLFCAEYCGTNHSTMIGRVVVMEPSAYEAWLTSGNVDLASATPESRGHKLFENLGCVTCHRLDGSVGRGPELAAVFGSKVQLTTGEHIEVDEDYIRESIMVPAAKTVAGFPQIMPTYKNQLNQEDVYQLIAFIKSLGDGTEGQQAS